MLSRVRLLNRGADKEAMAYYAHVCLDRGIKGTFNVFHKLSDTDAIKGSD
jgi:hypothetical protein